MTDSDPVVRARELAAAATPGPWDIQKNANGVAIYGPQYGVDPETGWNDKLVHLGHDYDLREPHGHYETAEFIAESRELVPVLCDIIDELRADLRWYADEAHYAARRAGGPSKILSDAGTRARNTLESVTPETQ